MSIFKRPSVIIVALALLYYWLSPLDWSRQVEATVVKGRPSFSDVEYIYKSSEYRAKYVYSSDEPRHNIGDKFFVKLSSLSSRQKIGVSELDTDRLLEASLIIIAGIIFGLYRKRAYFRQRK